MCVRTHRNIYDDATRPICTSVVQTWVQDKRTCVTSRVMSSRVCQHLRLLSACLPLTVLVAAS